MEHCKLQLGCLLIVLYIIFIYFRETRRMKGVERHTLFEALLLFSAFSLTMDAATAYTVNHLDTVHPTVNLILHALFLISIDTLIFNLALYILINSEGRPKKKSVRILVWVPFAVNILIVICNMHTLEYRIGETSNYSMGVSAYTCFLMAGFYMLFCVVTLLQRWNYIESHKRVGIITCLAVIVVVAGYQMLVPESLVTSIATTTVVLGAYMNQEAPMMQELSRYHDEMVMGFATLVESRDNSTGGHVKRTTAYVQLLARALRERREYREVLTKDYRKNLLRAAPMHDVGKIAIPDAILQKPGRLTEKEFGAMKEHTVKGGEIIQETFGNLGNAQYLEIAYQIALYHHEKWNGRGYPEGLSGEEIPLCARIMAVADVFDAVSEDRCYRAALPLEECFSIIEQGMGEDFDPTIARVFLSIRDQVEEVYREIG